MINGRADYNDELTSVKPLSEIINEPAPGEIQPEPAPFRKKQCKNLSPKQPEAKPSATQKNIMQKVTILLLDGTDQQYEVDKRSKGEYLLKKITESLNLLEKDYFGLTFRDSQDQKNWMDPAKEIRKQVKSGPWLFALNVKFYPPDPIQLSEDITRYQLVLQIREDILKGKLPCSFVTHALLGSYIVQSELGDYDPDEHGSDSSYLEDFRFTPNQTHDLEQKIHELHKTHKGQTPAEAELHYLENAKKLAMYGVDLHHARDSEGVDIMLGVCAGGLLIYRDRLRINRFAWPKILKISYKRNNFYIKIRPGEFELFESTIGFKLANHRAAKRLWKVCVEHHTFFRLVSPEAPPKKTLFNLGSKFRYSGKTQFQTRQASNSIDRQNPDFERLNTYGRSGSRELDRPDESTPQRHSANLDQVSGPGSKIAYADSENGDHKIHYVDSDESDHEIGVNANNNNLSLPRRDVDATSDEGEYEGEVYPQPPPKPAHQMKYMSHSADNITESEYPNEDNNMKYEVTTKTTTTRYEYQQSYPDQVNEEVKCDVAAADEDVPPSELPAPPLVDEGDPSTPSGAVAAPVARAKDDDDDMMVAPAPAYDGVPEVKTAMLKYQTGEDDDRQKTTEVPYVHTENTTITYEKDGTAVDGHDPGMLISAQTLTSESHMTTTTTHITKTVKGGVTETKVEKKIIIQGDGDIDHDRVLAETLAEEQERNPDFTVTKVVVHKEGEEFSNGIQD
ncbi:protein 4.1-like isoform X2 [Antedon mediterranea]|uniref:protein 4.1-like isoform X2 n=1 Tax=Antedon mediterranea TaxID=105859 RepID=UPI003AF9ACE1